MTAGEAAARGSAQLAAAGLDEARREAVALVRALTGTDPRLFPDRELPPGQAEAVARAVGRRRLREPFAYIVGVREFWGFDVEVRPSVFIPRPETELLVERALRRMGEGLAACDLCTGSGAVAIALARGCAGGLVDAVDISPEALEVARRNVQRLGVAHRVRLRRGDLFQALPGPMRGRYGLCTCNPPYVLADAWGGLAPEVREWEPIGAFVAPEGWQSMYARLGAEGLQWLRPGGVLLCEVGAGQAEAVAGILAARGMRVVGFHRDLAGVERVLEAERP